MNRSTFAAGLVLLAILAASPAFAAGNTDIQGVESAKVPLGKAILAAQKACGGKIIKAAYETGAYQLTCAAKGQFGRLTVDPQTGAATKAKPAAAGSGDAADLKTIQAAKVDLAGAIHTAETFSAQGARAMSIGLSTARGEPAYKVTMASGAQTSDLWIDIQSGNVLQRKP